ncbi:MAG: hypothetical protein QXS21_05990 [Thermoproteota archaeon]
MKYNEIIFETHDIDKFIYYVKGQETSAIGTVILIKRGMHTIEDNEQKIGIPIMTLYFIASTVVYAEKMYYILRYKKLVDKLVEYEYDQRKEKIEEEIRQLENKLKETERRIVEGIWLYPKEDEMTDYVEE